MSEGIDERVADALLDALASDDAFRERFAKGPDAALRELGHDGAVSIAECCTAPLPDKHVFKESRDAFRRQLTSRLSLKIFQL